ncbi:hypothetical protein [Bacteroides sp.]
MINIELEAAKANLIREILGIEDAGQLDRVKHLLHSFREEEKAPCRFTVDELKREIAAAEAEFVANGVGYTADEVNGELRREIESL